MAQASKINPISTAAPKILVDNDQFTQTEEQISSKDSKTAKGEPESTQGKINIDLKAYSHIPSLAAVSVGIAFGAARIIAAKCLLKIFPWIVAAITPLSPPSAGLSIIYGTAMAIWCLLVPFFEEMLYRDKLKNPTFTSVVKNSIVFGLMHGLLPGSVSLRMARIFMSTIGGFFYCGAKILGKDTYSPAIAHSMYNLNSAFGIFRLS